MYKKLLFALLAVFCVSLVAAPHDAFAQKKGKKSKAEKAKEKREIKKWKKKLKAMDPLKFRDMVEDYGAIRGQASGLKRQVEEQQGELEQLRAQVAAKDDEVAQMQQRMQEMAQRQKPQDVSSNASTQWDKGIVFKVQIGAFRDKDLTKFTETGNFWAEDKDGVKKYTIGNFREYWEADAFKKYLREMGVKDAWIVSYENGVRTDIKDVLEQGGGAGAAAKPAGSSSEEETGGFVDDF